jgi:hypothetical protein
MKICEDFLLGFWKGGAKKVKVILEKCKGGGDEIVDFFFP